MDYRYQEKLKGYAKLIVMRGVALEKNQILVITAQSETLYFARIIAEAAYEFGASDVQVLIEDEAITRLRYKHSSIKYIEEQLLRTDETRRIFTEKNACFIRINSSNPDLLLGLNQERVSEIAEASISAGKASTKSSTAFDVRRHASPAPTVEWAEKVFPGLKEEKAVEAMWKVILYAAYADGADVVTDWDRHIEEMKKQKEALNRYDFTELYFKNNMGTDLMIGLTDDPIWYGGNCFDIHGNEFSPSIPTDEIFAAPHYMKINGTVKNTIPLYYKGACIDGFSITFKNGKVIDFSAEKGQGTLAKIIDTDKGSCSLGEVSLVPSNSRIAESGLLFYETQCDENRSCHLALGAGYAGCVGGNDRSMETLCKKGLNYSAVHVDFMFGTDDMIVTGKTKDGSKIIIMKNGSFVI